MSIERIAPAVGASGLLAWLLYLLIAPTVGFGWIESWHNEQRAVQIGLLGLTGMVLALQVAAHSAALRGVRTLVWLIGAFVALGLASSARSQLPSVALAEVSLFVLMVFLVASTALAAAGNVERALRIAESCALLIASAHVLATAVRYGAALSLGRGIDADVLMLGYANPRFPSALHTLLLPFLAALVARPTARVGWRALAAVVATLLLTINLGLGTRGIWFAFLLAVPAAAMLFGWQAVRRPVIALAACAAASVLFYWLLFFLVPMLIGQSGAVASPTDNLSTLSSREVIWWLALDAIRAEPALGIGPMHFAVLSRSIGAHPHNWPLQVASEWGLPALGVLCAALLALAAGAKTGYQKFPDMVAPAFAVLAGLALGLVDGNLVMPVSQSAFALMLGLLVAPLLTEQGPQRPTRGFATALAVIPVAVTAGGGALLLDHVRASYLQQARSTAQFRLENPGKPLVPRLFEQGLEYPELRSSKRR